MKYPAGDDRKLKKIIIELAKSSSEPFYLYDEAVILRNRKTVDDCFFWQDGYINYFPVRENPNPSLLSVLWNAGSGVLACGSTELSLCKRLGFSGDRVMYQPDIPDAEGAAIALEMDAVWLVTSPSLLPTKPCNTVILRYCPDQPTRSAVSSRTKNGLTKAELLDMLRILHVRKVPRIGLEVQLKSFDYSAHAYSNKAKVLFTLLEEIILQSEAQISIVNLGDAVRQDIKDTSIQFSFEQEITFIRKLYEKLPLPHRPVIQTALSRHILESAGVLVSRVIEIRHLHQKQLILNVSAAQFLRPALFRSSKNISILAMSKKPAPPPQLYNVVGTIPEEFDRLVPDRVLLSPTVNDICVIHDVGCGARSMPMLYRFCPICAEYSINTDGNVRKIAEGRSSAEVMEFLIGCNYDL